MRTRILTVMLSLVAATAARSASRSRSPGATRAQVRFAPGGAW